jgi:small subunit ribosomal protein S9
MTAREVTKNRKYFEAVGRRRRSTARVRLYPGGKGEMSVNDLPVEEYFPGEISRIFYRRPFDVTAAEGKFDVSARVSGGGKQGQLEALVHGLARALVKADANHRTPLKKQGLLKRDPRMKERKKPGRVKARKKRQSPKR